MEHRTGRRVVITGVGVVAASGIGQHAFWQATSKGISGIKPIQRFPTADLPIQVAGEVSDFMVSDYIDRKLAHRTDRVTHLVLTAAQEALLDAQMNLAEEDPKRVGCVIANTLGGVEFALEQMKNLYTRGPRTMSAYTAIAWLPVANAGQISIRYGLQGYCKTPLNDSSGGLDALGMACGAIRRGAADIIFTGGSEAALHPFILNLLGSSSDLPYYALGDDIAAYRPFDRRARGMIVAEGAGVCMLEEYEHARRRGATIYGEITGYAMTNDAHGLLPPSVNGRLYARALAMAMRQSGLTTQDIGYFSLDGRALALSDLGEADALRQAFGAESTQLAVSVPRTTQGHSYAASGVIDTITALLALRDGLIPPTINCEELDPAYGLHMVRDEARPLQGSAVLIGGRGFGGINEVVTVQKV